MRATSAFNNQASSQPYAAILKFCLKENIYGCQGVTWHQCLEMAPQTSKWSQKPRDRWELQACVAGPEIMPFELLDCSEAADTVEGSGPDRDTC